MPHPTASELLGYPPDARLLIINCDDFGVSHAVNAAILRSLKRGIATSTTLMTPCPWALHAMRLLRDHPELAFGVHLTIISEYPDYRWGPLSPRDRVSSLLDEDGYFHTNDYQNALLGPAKLDEVEREFRAQIELVLKHGLQPTHLDWHCLRDGGRPDIFDLTVELALEYGLALRVFDPPTGQPLRERDLPTPDHQVVDSTRLPTAGKTSTFVRMLHALPPGLTEWAVHPGIRTAEAQAIDGWWAKKVADTRFLLSPEARETIKSEGITLVDYRPLQAIWQRHRA